MFSNELRSEHRGNDDLLTAGLGLAGLRAMVPPAFADAAHPTTAELRRRALWANWRGIADLAPGGGYGEVYGSTASVPGVSGNVDLSHAYKDYAAIIQRAGLGQVRG